ncbi:MAG TPA: glycosyltransferase family 2 protein, partial [Candidatus Nanoarchaeia archaeon]|nr:glycosyltransferase family 2 protein [Candidatus Nanoarchaeia archaeon]
MERKKALKKSIKLVVIIPAYNEASSLPIVLKNIPKKLLGIKEVQVVVIDDGSTDSTVDIAKSFNCIVISNGRNMGVGYSFQKGIEKAIELHADILVNMDADGQFSPLDIEKLVYPILEGKADMVTASRFKDKTLTYKMPFIKKFGNKAFIYLINTLTHKKFTDVTCGFRSYSKEAMLNLTVFGQFTYT